jgi:hypothetical protein
MYQHIFATLILLLSFNHTQAQRRVAFQNPVTNYLIEYNSKQKPVRHQLKSVNIQQVNNFINLYYQLENGASLQVNHIPVTALKDTAGRIKGIRMVYISSNQDTTYVSDDSRLPLKLITKCPIAKPGEPLSVFALGRVYLNKSSLVFESQFYGKIPANEMIKIDNLQEQ